MHIFKTALFAVLATAMISLSGCACGSDPVNVAGNGSSVTATRPEILATVGIQAQPAAAAATIVPAPAPVAATMAPEPIPAPPSPARCPRRFPSLLSPCTMNLPKRNGRMHD